MVGCEITSSLLPLRLAPRGEATPPASLDFFKLEPVRESVHAGVGQKNKEMGDFRSSDPGVQVPQAVDLAGHEKAGHVLRMILMELLADPAELQEQLALPCQVAEHDGQEVPKPRQSEE